MLEPWIIEQIRRREEEQRRQERPRLEIPLHDEHWKRERRRPEDEREDDDEAPKTERGVVIIPM